MKTIIITAIILTAAILNLNAQTQEWASRKNGPGNLIDAAYSTAVDALGNSYVTGYSRGSGTGDDYSTIKYNSSGVQQWEARYNGPGNSTDIAHQIKVDGSGNVYVTGYSRSGAAAGTEDYATIKYNSGGVQQWASRYNGPGNSDDIAQNIAVDGSGNVYVTGYSPGTGTGYDYATIKYNASGDSLWVRRYNGPGNSTDLSYRIAVSNSGNVYVTGYSRSSSAVGSEDIATIKYNSTGVEQWVQRYNNGANDAGYSISVDASDNVYVTGFVYNGFGGLDYITIKYNSSGVQKWLQTSGGYVAYSIAVDGSGNVYVTGSSSVSGSNPDYYTIKYDSAGSPQWSKIYNGPGNNDDEAYSLALDNSGNVYVTGYSRSGTTAGTEDYATVKYNSAGVQQWVQRYNGPGDSSDVAHSIAVDGSGNVYVTGGSMGIGTGSDYATIKYSQTGIVLNLTLTAFIEGFYNQTTNNMVSDTGRVYLRNATAPYAIVDSSKAKLDISGAGNFSFTHAVNGTPYYIVVKHRNSIETWSNTGNSFVSNSLTYNFSTAANKAYGNNLKSVDASPVRFAIYSGDVIRDGFVNLTDIIKVYNDGTSFIFGYVPSDINGDNSVNLTDLLITYNNSSGFVSIKRP